jgi:asparagine synthetase B (glutamine-hydrolysing)
VFFFTADDNRWPCDVAAVARAFRVYGPTRTLTRNGARIVWIEDRFVRVHQSERRLSIECARPGFDAEPVCGVEWLFASGTLISRRRWSGEFGVWHWRKPPIVATHLRLAAVALGMARVPAPIRLPPAHELRLNLRTMQRTTVRTDHLRAHGARDRIALVRKVRKHLRRSVREWRRPVALLLSGGIDSSAIAATAVEERRKIRAFVFTLARAIRPQPAEERDLPNARRVARHLGISLTELPIDAHTLQEQVPLAVTLAESARGTIVDECAAHVSVARALRRSGLDTVCVGEAADDLFGSFLFPLRFYRGAALRRYYQREIESGMPEELAVLQNVFRRWGISVIDPYWTRELVELGYNLPLAMRLDRHRLMKTVLREAFVDALPLDIVMRPKCVTRDATQIRDALERRFGRSRERYRRYFRFDTPS